MVNNHSYSFFGQKVGLIIQSASKNEPFIFFRLIKSKNDGSWEKPSSGEGKIIKFSLEEMVSIIRVLTKEVNSWSSYHTYKDNKTQISFKWEDGEKVKLWIHIGSYSKVLEYSQIKILEMLLEHILKEKIEFATVPNSSKKGDVNKLSNIVVQEEIIMDTSNKLTKNSEVNGFNDGKPREIKDITGTIKGETDKALLIQFDNEAEVWIPKSTIHSGFNNAKNLVQKFSIDSWILIKNKIES
ncbi:MAG: hypothetical protein HWN81_16680 [Candidatus Lokiarchaeota archaeon]|nr:hypothetical protein [Candidatus Lokiarchaeota archaeon]